MANTIVGTIELVAKIDTSKFKAEANEVNRTAESMADTVGESADKAEKRGSSAFSRFSRSAISGLLKISSIVSGALTGAVTGLILQGGISRALNIEDAQAKLRGLGHDAKNVQTIMESALASVKGTAYGLDAAATIAAGAVAAGIKPGKELTKYLSMTADAATIAGSNLDEMGSVLNRVQTSQKAYTEDLNMLADRGIPIFQWLQEEYKVTATELRSMVSDGEIDAATYFKVIQKNIGGAALESGATTRGAWANMRAAMSRVGAAIVKDIIPRVRDGFGSLTKWFDANSDNIVNAVGKALSTIKSLALSSIDLARRIGSFLQPSITALINSFRNILPVLSEFLTTYLRPIAQVLGGVFVGALWLATNTVRVVIQVLQSLLSWLNQNSQAVMSLTIAVGAFLVALRGYSIITTFATAIASIGTVSSVATAGIGLLRGALIALYASITPVTAVVGGLAAVAGILASNWLYGKTQADRLREAQDRLRESSQALKDAQANGERAALNLEGAGLRVERATKSQQEAIKQYGAGSLEAREATHQLEQANNDLKNAQSEVARTSGEILQAQLEQAKAMEREREEVRKTAKAYEELQKAKRNASTSYAGGSPRPSGGFGFGFASGGFTGRGGTYEPAGIVHKGEYVLPKTAVDQSTGMPKFDELHPSIENNIGTINISDQQTADYFLKRLTNNQEITSQGLVPLQSYGV